MYLVFSSLSANDFCTSSAGRSILNITVSFRLDKLTTRRHFVNSTSDVRWSCDGSEVSRLNWADMRNCTNQGTRTMNEWTSHPCVPYLVLPSMITSSASFENLWPTCTLGKTWQKMVWDLPRVLAPAALLGASTTSTGHQSEATPAAPGSSLGAPIASTTSVYAMDPPASSVPVVSKPKFIELDWT